MKIKTLTQGHHTSGSFAVIELDREALMYIGSVVFEYNVGDKFKGDPAECLQRFLTDDRKAVQKAVLGYGHGQAVADALRKLEEWMTNAKKLIEPQIGEGKP